MLGLVLTILCADLLLMMIYHHPTKLFVIALDNVQVPISIQEAPRNPIWRKAVNEEIKALEKE